MKQFYIVLVSVMLSSICWANESYTVSGRVTDTKQQAIPFASVVIANTTIGTVSDLNGEFKLCNIGKGRVQLLVKSMGYEQVAMDINLNGKLHVVADAQLSESVHNLNEVFVKGQNKSSQIERSGFSVSSVDVKALESKSMELNEILDQTPGLKVRRDGGLGSNTTYNINGLSGNAVRIFIDGIPMESFGSSYSVNSIPVSLIERVDVYKGVVPIELGNDAMGGAINIITKKQSHNTANASYSVGSFNTHQAAVSGSARNAKTGLTTRASAFYNYSDNNYKVWSDNVIITDDNMYLPDGSKNPDFGSITRGEKVERFNDAYESYGAKVEVGVTDKKWADQLFLSINASQGYNEIQHGATMLSVYGERYTTNYSVAPSLKYSKKDLFIEGLNVSASMQYSYSENALVDTTTNSYNWYGDVRPPVVNPPVAGEGGTATLNVDKNTNYVGRMGLSYSLNDNNMVSATYSLNNFIRSSDDEMRTAAERNYGSTNNVNKQIVGFNYQNTAFDDKLRSSVFSKYYSNSLSQDKVEMTSGVLDTINMANDFSDWGYGFTLAYQVSPKVQISASAEKAVRLVSASEVFGNVSNNIVESPDLQPETSLNVNLGTMYTPINDGFHTLNVSGNLFYRDTKDKIRRAPVVDATMDNYEYTNLGHVVSKGIEMQVDYNLGAKYDFMVQAYYLDSRFKEQYTPEGSIDLRYNSREPNVPYLTASFSAARHWASVFSTNDKLSVSWYGSYVHEFHLNWEVLGSQNKEVIPSQFINDVSVSYAFPNNKVRVSLDGKNIFNKLAFDNYAIQKPGRAIFLKVSYQF